MPGLHWSEGMITVGQKPLFFACQGPIPYGTTPVGDPRHRERSLSPVGDHAGCLPNCLPPGLFACRMVIGHRCARASYNPLRAVWVPGPHPKVRCGRARVPVRPPLPPHTPRSGPTSDGRVSQMMLVGPWCYQAGRWVTWPCTWVSGACPLRLKQLTRPTYPSQPGTGR
jgi:hypothetical protein